MKSQPYLLCSPKTKGPGEQLGQGQLEADLIGHFQEVKDVHFCRRVISTGQQSVKVWDRWRDALPVDHIVQVSAKINRQQYRPPSAAAKCWDTTQAWESCRKVLVCLLGHLLGRKLPSG